MQVHRTNSGLVAIYHDNSRMSEKYHEQMSESAYFLQWQYFFRCVTHTYVIFPYSQDNNLGLLISATQSNIDQIRDSRTWYIDETISCVPKLYEQMV